MGDTLKAFLEFLVDLFAALSTFLGGKIGTIDLSGILGIFGDDEAADDDAAGDVEA